MHSRSWSRGAVLLALVSVTVTSTANALFEPRYERCEALLDRREVMDVCGHSINPSAVAYLPSARRLVIAGQEYLIHATESGSGRLAVDGCYFGADRSLGRGDIEGIASLDFALSKPEPNMDPSGRLTANWAKLKALEGHILAMEENYAFRGVYLVDTGRLGSGLTRAESATVQRFPISEYLRNLEAVAFVPDLTDDAYLGILLMGSQNRRIQACRIPLGDSSKPVRCEDKTARYSRSVDSMEYDPTFEVRPGVFGALVIGADPADHGVYVDPWALALRGEVVRWSDEFAMRGGSVGGVRMTGREGHAIYGDKVFYALDEGKRASGAVVCRMSTKPRSRASSISGWHPTDAGDPNSSTPAAEFALSATNALAAAAPSPWSASEPMDALKPVREVTPEYMLQRWPAYARAGDGECGSLCQSEKSAMCVLYPELCVHLRCQDVLSGADTSFDMGDICDGTDSSGAAIGSPEALAAAALTEANMVTGWRQVRLDNVDGRCDGSCLEFKALMCDTFAALCQQLQCEDQRMGAVSEVVSDCETVPAPLERGMLLPITLRNDQMSARWAAHHQFDADVATSDAPSSSAGEAEAPTSAGLCNRRCQEDKRQMCLGNPTHCWALRCSDIRAGITRSVLDCDDKPPAEIMMPGRQSSTTAAAVEGGLCKWNGCGSSAQARPGGYCSASLANCVSDCEGSWCPSTPGYEAVLPWKAFLLGAEPVVSGPAAGSVSVQSQSESSTPAAGSKHAAGAPSTPEAERPVLGYCNWDGCNGEEQGSEWCRESVDNCVFTCGGSWCWHAPAGHTAEIKPSESPRPHSDSVPAPETIDIPPPLPPAAPVDTRPQVRNPPVTSSDVRLPSDRREAATGSSLLQGPTTDDLVVTLNVDDVAGWLGLQDDRVARLVAILEGIPNVSLTRNPVDPGIGK